jgi:hypothetical protein
MFPRVDSRLGSLTMDEVLVYNDGPLVFLCCDDLGHYYFAIAVDRAQNVELFLYVPISEERRVAILTGALSVRAAVQRAETSTIFLVSIGLAGFDDTVREMNAHAVPDDWLPSEEAYFTEPVETALHYSQEGLALMAERQQRSLSALEFDSARSLRTEIPLARAGTIMTEFQDLASAVASLDRTRGRFEHVGDVTLEAELSFVQLAAASFVLIVSPNSPNQLLALPSTAMENVAKILDATSDPNELVTLMGRWPLRIIPHVRNFFDAVSDLDSGVVLCNATPGNDLRSSRLSLPEIRTGLQVLRTRSALPSRSATIVGHLMAINHILGTFGIVEDRPTGGRRKPRTFTGKFDSQLAAEMDGLPTGQSRTYEFDTVEDRDAAEFEGAKPHSRFRLVALRPVAQMGDTT